MMTDLDVYQASLGEVVQMMRSSFDTRRTLVVFQMPQAFAPRSPAAFRRTSAGQYV